MNKVIKKNILNQSGSTVIMITILAMAAILTASLSLGSVVTNGLKASKSQANATQAYFAAESGAERILWEIRKNDFDPATTTPAVVCTDDQYFATTYDSCFDDVDVNTIINQTNGSLFYVNYKVTVSTTTLTSYGEYLGTRRVIKLEY